MSTTATITATFEIEVDSTWGDDCDLGQVKAQAMREAKGTIAKIANISRGVKLVAVSDSVNVNLKSKI